MLCFLYSFCSRLFLDLVSILAPFSSSEDNFGAVQIDFFQETGPRGLQKAFCIAFGSQGDLQEAFGIDFGTQWVAFGNVWEGVGEIFGRLWGSAQRTKVRCTLYAVR